MLCFNTFLRAIVLSAWRATGMAMWHEDLMLHADSALSHMAKHVAVCQHAGCRVTL